MTHFVDKGYRAMLAEIDSLSDEILRCSEAHEAKDALIRELVAALDRIAKGAMYIEDFTASTSAVIWAKFAIAKAKAAGYEP